MPSTYFGGNKSKSGGALFVTFSSKEQAVYFRLIKQTGWNEQTSKPSFAGGESFNIKLSPDEAGEIIYAIRNHDEFKFYHKFNEDVTSGSLSYYEKEYTGKDGKPHKTRGFGLTVRKGATEVKLGLSTGSAERLSQYLTFAFDHIHSAIYSQDKKEFEEYQKSKEAAKAPVKTAATPAKPAFKVKPKVEPEPVAEEVEEQTEEVPIPELVSEEEVNW